MRGFGIDATVPLDVATEVALRAEQAGYESFWVNGSPARNALDIVSAAASHTDLDVGVGVFPLTDITAADVVAEVVERDIPQHRLWLGVGSNRRPGALAEVRDAVDLIRAELDVRVTMGAVGPRMTRLAGEVADAVIFTWWIAAEVVRSRSLLEEGSALADRPPPTVVSYIRCALLPQAAEAIERRARFYQAIPHYAEVFERNAVTASDTVVTGRSRDDLLPGIEAEEEVLDHSVIRAIPAEDTVESLAELVEACRP